MKITLLTALFVNFILLNVVFCAVRYNEELSTELTKLWNLDVNRCEPVTDYKLNIQGYVTGLNWTYTDRARENLFSFFDEEKIFNKPTYKAFKQLLDNYETETDKAEVETDQEKQEIRKFMDEIMKTEVMKEAHRYLVSKRKANENISVFKTDVQNLWFKMYKRLSQDRYVNSCGFEHVFVGEKRSAEITGFHNWIQIYLEEKQGNLDYRGYFRRGTTEETETHPRMMTYQFVWKRQSGKSIGSNFIGTSPEFEIALYTIVFKLGFRSAPAVHIKNYDVEIITFAHGREIGSAYPRSLSN